MPVQTKKIRGKWRVVEKDGKIVLNKGGTAVNGGGFLSKADAVKQAQAMNLAERRRRGLKVPRRKRR